MPRVSVVVSGDFCCFKTVLEVKYSNELTKSKKRLISHDANTFCDTCYTSVCSYYYNPDKYRNHPYAYSHT